MKNLVKKILRTKPATYLRILTFTYRLPGYIPFFETQIKRLQENAAQTESTTSTLEKDFMDLQTEIQESRAKLRGLESKVLDIKHQLLTARVSGVEQDSKTVNNTMADDPSHDKFYKDFEDRFRGTEEMIVDRLEEYAPRLKSLSVRAKKLPVLDIGCGRGEFIQVTKRAGLKAIGVDMNRSMVERAKSLGYEAYENDALSFLMDQKSSSFSVISGFHLVEHIPFPDLLKIFEECFRVIHEDGFVLFETPNPNNLSVGASNFYMDPSHIKPLPPALLSFALETQGFHTQILELHPAKSTIKHKDPVVEDMMRMLYGPLDYAVLASKNPIVLS